MAFQVSAIVSKGLVIFAGVIVFTTIIWPIFSFIALHLRSGDLPRLKHPSQPWALVTGASDGIGYGYVTELASQGFNIILHGRNSTKLDGLVSKLRKEYPAREFRTLVVGASDRSAWQQLDSFAKSLLQEKLALTLLVNNVGGVPGSRVYNSIHELSQDGVNQCIDMNATFPAQITRSMLPVLSRNQPAAILVTGSAAAFVTLPYLAVYSGAKAFTFSWSSSLRLEMIAEKVDVEVLTINVGKVQTAASKQVAQSFFVPTSRQMARAALQKLGCGKPFVTGYWPHAVQLVLFPFFPQALQDSASVSMGRQEMEDERKSS